MGVCVNRVSIWQMSSTMQTIAVGLGVRALD